MHYLPVMLLRECTTHINVFLCTEQLRTIYICVSEREVYIQGWMKRSSTWAPAQCGLPLYTENIT